MFQKQITFLLFLRVPIGNINHFFSVLKRARVKGRLVELGLFGLGKEWMKSSTVTSNYPRGLQRRQALLMDTMNGQTWVRGTFWAISCIAKSCFFDLQHPWKCFCAFSLFKIHLILLLCSNRKPLDEQIASVGLHSTSVSHEHKHKWPWVEGNICTSSPISLWRLSEPKQTFGMPHSLSRLSFLTCFLNFEHLRSINPFYIFLHSGFTPADPSQGSHVGSSKPWDVPSDQPEPSSVRTRVPARTHTL